MNIIGIIPARFASTRLPGKPLVDICGKTMIQRVYEQAKQASLLTDVIIATDDERIADEAKKFNAKVVLTSPDIQSGSDRIAFVAKQIAVDIVVNIQGDEPLIDPKLIDQTIQALLDDTQAVVSTAVKKTSLPQEIFNSSVVKVVMDKEFYAMYFSRSPIPHIRDAKNDAGWINGTTFYKHFGIYVYRAEFLQQYTSLPQSALELAEKLEQLRILEHGYKIKCVATEYESVPVDTKEDLEKVIRILEQKK